MLLFSGIALAGNSWLEKGKEIMDQVGKDADTSGLKNEEISAGLKEALRVGSETVVSNLGRKDGFYKDAKVHIPLPKQLDRVKAALNTIGMSKKLDDLELKINRAAEVATPKAKNIFRQAIMEMSFEDVKSIFNGPQDAATQYFRKKMSPSLASEMKPIVDDSLNDVGAIKAYDDTMAAYTSVPFVPDIKSDMSGYVVEKGIEGIFHYMAEEEAAIRNNPAKRTTELLERVFGL